MKYTEQTILIVDDDPSSINILNLQPSTLNP